MSIDRIFSELDSRNFRFTVEGRTFELPHMNRLKKQVKECLRFVDDDKNIDTRRAMFFLFDSAGNPEWSDKYRDMKLRDAIKIFTAWEEWSGFTLGKSLARGKR